MLVATIANTDVSVYRDSLSIGDNIDEQGNCSFSVIDLAGTAHFSKNQPVVITDTQSGKELYTGYINNRPKAQVLYPNPARVWALVCRDQTWCANKRSSNKVYRNQYAGTILVDMVQRYGSPEGLICKAGLGWYEELAEWQAGTMSGTVATTNASSGNVGDGDLELAAAGSTVTFVQESQTDFSGRPIGGLALPASGGVTFAPTPAIKLQATQNIPGLTGAYAYMKIWDKSVATYTIPANAYLFYDVWIPDSSPQAMATVDVVCTDGTSFVATSSSWTPDLQGQSGALTSDLSGLATNQWYSRRLPLFGGGSLSGKTVQYVAVAFGGSNQGAYTAYFRNIYLAEGDAVTNKLTVFGTTATAIAVTPQQLQTSGYMAISCTLATTYERHGFLYGQRYDLSAALLARSSYVSWDIDLPADMTFTVTASVDAGATFLPCTNNASIPGLLPGMVLSAARYLVFVYVFDSTNSSPELTPLLRRVSGAVNPASMATKNDVVGSFNGTTGFAAGTLTNLINTASNALQLNGFARNWDDANYGSQTLYGSASPAQGMLNRQFYLQTNSGTDVRSRLDFAGSSLQNFTMECDVQFVATSTEIGFVYRTTGWQNANDTYGYAVRLTPTTIGLAKGTNTSSGAGGFTSIVTAAVSLQTGQMYRLKVIVNGTSHQIFLNDVRSINQTDSSYTAAGYVGLRFYNATGSTQKAIFDNFGIVSALSGTWVSPAIDIHAIGTISNSQLLLQIDPAANTTICTFGAEISLDNGSTWTACTNTLPAALTVVGGEGFFQTNPVPGLGPGTNVSGMSQVKLRLTIAATTAATGNAMPDIQAVTFWALGAYSASGTWTSSAISLANVGRAATSLLNWNATIPTNTSLAMATSVDNSVSWQPVANPGDAIPNVSMLAHYQAVRTRSPLAFYRLNERSGSVIADSSNHGNTVNLTQLSNLTLGQPGALQGINEASDTSILFNGSGWVDLPTSLNGNGRSAFSFSGWFQLSTAALGSFTNLLFSGTSGVHTGYQLYWSSTTSLNFVIGNGTADSQVSYATTPVAGAWMHLVGTYDGTSVKFYVNGVLRGTNPQSGAISASAVPVLGASTTHTQPFPGSIQGLAFFASALQQADVTAIYTAGTAATQSVTEDIFVENSSADYTQSNFSGATGAWTWDTANSRLVGSGGTNGTLVNNIALSAADNQVMADFDQCDGSGLVANYVDANNLYYVQIWDASGTGTQNSVKLFKRSGGVNTQLGATIAISWTRGRFRRFILDVQAGVLTVSMDGVQLLQQTDGSPLAAGNAGLLLNALARCYRLRIQQYAPDVSLVSLATRYTLSSTDPTATPQILDAQTFVASEDIDLGALIPKADYRRKYLSDNFADLNTKSATTWTSIRPDKSVVFRQRTATPAPWILDSANETQLGGKMQGDLLVANLDLTTSGDLYRNRQILTGVQGTGTFSETRAGDGQTRTWNLSNPLASAPTILLNGQSVAVGVKNVDTERQYYWQPGSATIDQDANEAILQKGDTLSFPAYMGTFISEVVRDNATAGTFPGTLSQAELAAIDGTSGIVENVLDASALNLDVAAAEAYGDQLLTKYGDPEARTLTFDTLRGGLAPGQLLPAFVPEQSCIDGQFLITSVKTTAQLAASLPGGVLYRYSITATEGANLGSAWKLLSGLLK